MNNSKLSEYYDLIKLYQDNPPTVKDGYCEWHHIVMRSLGGSNTKDNKVLLPVIEHIRAHVLLAQAYEDDLFKLAKARNALSHIVNGKSTQIKHIDPASITEDEIALIAKAREEAAKAKKNQFLIYEIATGKKKRWPNGMDIPTGWAKGAPCTKDEFEHRSKIYGRRKWITNPTTGEDKFIDVDDVKAFLDSGWKYGRMKFPAGWRERRSAAAKLQHPSIKGMIWINDGKGNHRVISKDLPIPDGWAAGRVINESHHDNMYSDELIELHGEKKRLIDWCRQYGISAKRVHSRLHHGMPIEQALTQAVRTRERIFEFEGETHTVKEWAEIKGVSAALLKGRLGKGWTFEKAITEPFDRSKVRRKHCDVQTV